jgi:hypothetical protein
VKRLWTVAVGAGTTMAVLGLLNTWRNLKVMRTAPAEPNTDGARISVLLPLRNEASRVRPCLEALIGQEFDELLVLDDASDDDTAAVVTATVGRDERLMLLIGDSEPPPGWLGKPWACQRLADAASGDVLVFLDADVVLTPDAVQRASALLLSAHMSAVCPYPAQQVHGVIGRLVQPLLQWSWLTTLPLDLAEASNSPATAAGNGQLFVTLARDYHAVGGHSSVRSEILEDVGLIRQFKVHGLRAGMADGTDLAVCTMYANDSELVAGYTKSLWAAFGSPAGAVGTVVFLGMAYVVPAVAMAVGPSLAPRVIGAVGYTAAIAGRWAVATRTRQRTAPDIAAHPLSIATFGWLVAESWRRRAQGTLTWRGRPVAVAPADTGLAG